MSIFLHDVLGDFAGRAKIRRMDYRTANGMNGNKEAVSALAPVLRPTP